MMAVPGLGYFKNLQIFKMTPTSNAIREQEKTFAETNNFQDKAKFIWQIAEDTN